MTMFYTDNLIKCFSPIFATTPPTWDGRGANNGSVVSDTYILDISQSSITLNDSYLDSSASNARGWTYIAHSTTSSQTQTIGWIDSVTISSTYYIALQAGFYQSKISSRATLNGLDLLLTRLA